MVRSQCQISLRQILTRRGKPGHHAPVLGDFEGVTRLHALKVATQVLSQLSNSYFRHCASYRSTLTENPLQKTFSLAGVVQQGEVDQPFDRGVVIGPDVSPAQRRADPNRGIGGQVVERRRDR